MRKPKEQWKPKIINLRMDGSVIEDLSKEVIPAGHPFYDVMAGINRRYAKQKEVG